MVRFSVLIALAAVLLLCMNWQASAAPKKLAAAAEKDEANALGNDVAEALEQLRSENSHTVDTEDEEDEEDARAKDDDSFEGVLARAAEELIDSDAAMAASASDVDQDSLEAVLGHVTEELDDSNTATGSDDDDEDQDSLQAVLGKMAEEDDEEIDVNGDEDSVQTVLTEVMEGLQDTDDDNDDDGVELTKSKRTPWRSSVRPKPPHHAAYSYGWCKKKGYTGLRCPRTFHHYHFGRYHGWVKRICCKKYGRQHGHAISRSFCQKKRYTGYHCLKRVYGFHAYRKQCCKKFGLQRVTYTYKYCKARRYTGYSCPKNPYTIGHRLWHKRNCCTRYGRHYKVAYSYAWCHKKRYTGYHCLINFHKHHYNTVRKTCCKKWPFRLNLGTFGNFGNFGSSLYG